MRKYLEKMGLNKFRQNSTFLYLVCDVWILGYVYKKFTNPETMDLMIKVAAEQQQLDKTHIKQLYQLMTQSLILMLVLVGFVHLINYILYNKNKKVAFAYLVFYSWTASIGTALWGLSLLGSHFIPGIVFLAVSGVFFFNAMGLRVFPHQEQELKKS
ncbi:MAG: hypothetical protein CME70_10760 [Halobacteriovorax sp.]|nr:hypothetical protein [Halobacteriovorax sp.]|tara:strand:+ start:73063 stop:73533 length:471 start_codon:yes stop_codon:yes gene_type:complete